MNEKGAPPLKLRAITVSGHEIPPKQIRACLKGIKGVFTTGQIAAIAEGAGIPKALVGPYPGSDYTATSHQSTMPLNQRVAQRIIHKLRDAGVVKNVSSECWRVRYLEKYLWSKLISPTEAMGQLRERLTQGAIPAEEARRWARAIQPASEKRVPRAWPALHFGFGKTAITELPISKKLISSLSSAGFTTADQLGKGTPFDLLNRKDIGLDVAGIHEIVNGIISMRAQKTQKRIEACFPQVPEFCKSLPIDVLNLHRPTRNNLRNYANLQLVGQLCELQVETALKFRNFGAKKVKELTLALNELAAAAAQSSPDPSVHPRRNFFRDVDQTIEQLDPERRAAFVEDVPQLAIRWGIGKAAVYMRKAQELRKLWHATAPMQIWNLYLFRTHNDDVCAKPQIDRNYKPAQPISFYLSLLRVRIPSGGEQAKGAAGAVELGN
jgi:hypothetical protein